jgi:sugar phosphate isomerase/epimerase
MQNTQRQSRRAFINSSLAIGAMTLLLNDQDVLGTEESRWSGRNLILLGGPAFANTDDPELLAAAHRKLGYRAAYCPNVGAADSEKIRSYREAFARHDVTVAEVGRWCNLMDQDEQKRRKNIDNVTDGLAVAEAINARCCVDIAGSFSQTSWFGPHPENLSKHFFDGAVENARKIIDAVKPSRTVFCYEMMGWALPDTPEHYLKLIKAVDRRAFAVHLDPCNIINSPEKFYNNTALLNDCFEKLGKHIVSCHAKDLAWNVEMNIHFKEVIPGTGSLDYSTYLKRVAQLPQNPPLMLEHLSKPEEYLAAADHIRSIGRGAGLSFE